MSKLLTKSIWYKVNSPNDPVLFTNNIRMNCGRGLDIKNNVYDVTLKSEPTDYSDSGILINTDLINKNGTIKFEDQDSFELYAVYTDDMAIVESSVWQDNTTKPSDTYLIGTYYIQDIDLSHTISSNTVKLTCADKSFILFNRLLAKTFTVIKNRTTPQCVQDVIRYASENEKGIYYGTGSNSGVRYDIDARLFSESIKKSGTTTSTSSYKLISSAGNFITNNIAIGDMVRNTTDETYAYVSSIDSSTQLTINRDIFVSGEGYQISDGFIQDTRNDGTAFPVTPFAKVWKPVYEWVGELSQIENINTSTEMTEGNVLLYGKQFIFWVDEKNRFHWIEPQDTIDENITVGTTTGVYNVDLTKSVFDVINFVIARCGKDLYGDGMLTYYIDATTNTTVNKMRVIAMTEEPEKAIRQEIANGNLVQDDGGVFLFDGKHYDKKAGTITPFWTSTSVSTEDDYNDSLRSYIQKKCTAKARDIVNRFTSARYKGTVRVKGRQVTLGNIIKITDESIGVKDVNIRVMDIKHNFDKNGWTTDITLEEDAASLEKYGGGITG